ncbi:MAG: 2-oxoacid:ferredoxin oxidoreductase subunit beta [Legionellales bacterium]|nr:2-oxoacid:ferredoxin oxidoreductase subunit beta [Legionellales bacterium]
MSLSKADFETSNEVRWCPGCGDYAVLATMQRMLPELDIAPENIAFISGIGCSSRFPYYMKTYGFHTIHGRAPTFATGLAVTRPELLVWVVTGDGDGLSIGSNHLLHLLRRNVNAKVMLFNNQIYGLTKGQYSPTSERGKVTKSSPAGSQEEPVNPLRFALAANASFVARGIDVDAKRLEQVLKAAALHQGSAFIEIYQNCNVFNDGAFASFSERRVRDAKTVSVFPGEKMIFGASQENGLAWRAEQWEIVDAEEADIWPHMPSEAQCLAMTTLTDPVPVGIFKQAYRDIYTPLVTPPKAQSRQKLQKLLHSGDVWSVSDKS